MRIQTQKPLDQQFYHSSFEKCNRYDHNTKCVLSENQNVFNMGRLDRQRKRARNKSCHQSKHVREVTNDDLEEVNCEYYYRKVACYKLKINQNRPVLNISMKLGIGSKFFLLTLGLLIYSFLTLISYQYKTKFHQRFTSKRTQPSKI